MKRACEVHREARGITDNRRSRRRDYERGIAAVDLLRANRREELGRLHADRSEEAWERLPAPRRRRHRSDGARLARDYEALIDTDWMAPLNA